MVSHEEIVREELEEKMNAFNSYTSKYTMYDIREGPFSEQAAREILGYYNVHRDFCETLERYQKIPGSRRILSDQDEEEFKENLLGLENFIISNLSEKMKEVLPKVG